MYVNWEAAAVEFLSLRRKPIRDGIPLDLWLAIQGVMGWRRWERRRRRTGRPTFHERKRRRTICFISFCPRCEKMLRAQPDMYAGEIWCKYCGHDFQSDIY